MRGRGLHLCAIPAVIAVAATAVAWALTSFDQAANSKSPLPQANEALDRREFQSCEQLLKVHLKDRPGDTGALFTVARLYKELGKFREASDLIIAIVSAKSRNTKQ